jgi:hypothetical protein
MKTQPLPVKSISIVTMPLLNFVKDAEPSNAGKLSQ